MDKISDLNTYYLRLLNLIESDIDTMISEPDITKRSPKIILEYLKMAKQCQEELKATISLDGNNDDWDALSDYTKDAITKLIADDVASRR